QPVNGVAKIVAAGSNGHDFAIVRYNTNGSLDPSFDGDGIVITDFGSSADEAFSVAVQSINGENKVVAAGLGFELARYNTDGSLDTSFGDLGKVTTPIGFASIARSVTIQPDGKIVAAGKAALQLPYNIALARY